MDKIESYVDVVTGVKHKQNRANMFSNADSNADSNERQDETPLVVTVTVSHVYSRRNHCCIERHGNSFCRKILVL
jgi:hypothetical protein